MTAHRILVHGASGGLGVTCLAAAIGARAAARDLRAVVVETRRGGLDVVAAVDGWPGVRLDDLHDLDGAVDGVRLLASLPAPARVAVLAHAADRPGPPLDARVQARVHAALARAGDLVVVDAGVASPASPAAATSAPGGGLRVLLVGPSPHQLALARHAPPPDVVALCGSPEDAQDVAGLLGVTHAVAVPVDPGVDRALARGACPGAGSRSRLGRSADALLDLLDSSHPPDRPGQDTPPGAAVRGREPAHRVGAT